jgi:hypothetical protein
MKTLKKINQLKYPKEFRILSMEMPLEALKQLDELIKNLSNSEAQTGETVVTQELNNDFLAEVSVGAWRLKKKMIDPKSGEPLNEMSRAYRHLESVLITLKNEGIEIQDHDGQPFDAGLSLKVLTYQPLPNIDKEYVYDTIKPSVYLKGERILMGEVIVATFQI